MTTAVIGAGPAGLTAAYQLAKAGCNVDVYEASPAVGGLARTLDLWGMKVDVGPHRFFSHDLRVNSLWLEVVKQDYQIVKRLTRIYYNGAFFDYPLKPLNALMGLGISEAARCVSSFSRQKFFPTSLDGSFESWVVHRFGRRLYEIFFQTYSEKLWGIPGIDLDDDFAAQRIKKLSLGEALKNALWKGNSNQHATLVDCFAYPTGGTGMVYNRMADFVKASGNQVYLNSAVEEVIVKDSSVHGIRLKDGEPRLYNQVISTMPLSHLVTSIKQSPENIRTLAGNLRFRNAVLVYLLVDGSAPFPDNWLYIHSATLKTGRITNFRNWVPQLTGVSPDTILVMEYWCDAAEEAWVRSNEDYIELAKNELAQTGLVGSQKVKDGFVLRISKCYPVYEKGYRKKLAPIEQYLDTINGLQAIGRFGAFKYNNQDHSMLMGILAAENSIQKAGHNLWAINTDYDDYQERSVITATGLLKR